MKIKLVDGTVYTVTRAEVTNGRLEVDIADKTAEEVQSIFSVPGNLQNIELLTEKGDKFGDFQGWTVYGGTVLVGEKKTAILTKAINVTEERLTAAESTAIQADAKAVEAKTLAEQTANNLDTAVVELSMAIAGGGTNV